MPRPKQRTPALRQQILASALDVLEREGLPALTTRAVATSADTSVPALYELFGDKAGLVRELFGEGFQRLQQAYDSLDLDGDPVADVHVAAGAFRSFARAHPELFAIMFTRPFASVEPSAGDRRAGTATRRFLVARMEAVVDRRGLEADATDLAHGLLGAMIGLAIQENGGWLGSSAADRDRRWQVAVDAYLGSMPARHW